MKQQSLPLIGLSVKHISCVLSLEVLLIRKATSLKGKWKYPVIVQKTREGITKRAKENIFMD